MPQWYDIKILKFIYFFSNNLFGQGSYFTNCKEYWQVERWDFGLWSAGCGFWIADLTPLHSPSWQSAVDGNSKLQITITKIQNSKPVSVIWYCNLEFICNLVLEI